MNRHIIEQLERDAAEHGDLMQAAICQIVLHAAPEANTLQALDQQQRNAIRRMTHADAYAACLRALGEPAGPFLPPSVEAAQQMAAKPAPKPPKPLSTRRALARLLDWCESNVGYFGDKGDTSRLVAARAWEALEAANERRRERTKPDRPYTAAELLVRAYLRGEHRGTDPRLHAGSAVQRGQGAIPPIPVSGPCSAGFA